MGHPHGDPIRFAFFGSTGVTSVPLGIFLPGSNTPYVPLPTDFFFITSMISNEAAGNTYVVSSTGITNAQLSSSTLLLSFSGATAASFWHEELSEALSPPQGIVPSVLSSSSTAVQAISGTGFVVHSPGYTQPWQITNVPGQQIPAL